MRFDLQGHEGKSDDDFNYVDLMALRAQQLYMMLCTTKFITTNLDIFWLISGHHCHHPHHHPNEPSRGSCILGEAIPAVDEHCHMVIPDHHCYHHCDHRDGDGDDNVDYGDDDDCQ